MFGSRNSKLVTNEELDEDDIEEIVRLETSMSQELEKGHGYAHLEQQVEELTKGRNDMMRLMTTQIDGLSGENLRLRRENEKLNQTIQQMALNKRKPKQNNFNVSAAESKETESYDDIKQTGNVIVQLTNQDFKKAKELPFEDFQIWLSKMADKEYKKTLKKNKNSNQLLNDITFYKRLCFGVICVSVLGLAYLGRKNNNPKNNNQNQSKNQHLFANNKQ